MNRFLKIDTFRHFQFFVISLFLLMSPPLLAASDPIGALKVPAGFKIDLFAHNLPNARTMVEGKNGTIFIGTRSAGRVYAIHKDKAYTIAKGLNMPNGIAFHKGSLYVAEVSRILRYDNIENTLSKPPKPVVIRNNLPKETHHGWRYIAFGPDNRLYISIGVPCNICLEENFAQIRSMKADGSDERVEARGIRNSVGFTWHPQTKQLWLTDNGRDWMGDDLPPDEINRVTKRGQHFGFPYCHGGKYPDDEFTQQSCDKFSHPALALGAHVAPLGITFYTGTQFPKEYRNQIFVAEHGSWNRTKKSGYRVMMATLKGNNIIKYQDFITGWLDNESVRGRPAYTLVLSDGSMLVSDDKVGTIYRVSYAGL